MRKHSRKFSSALTAIVLVFLLGNVCFSGTVVINDEFDDGNLATNTGGIGSGWNITQYNATPVETGGAVVVAATREQSNVILQSKDTDEFPVWNSDGITATWVIKNITMQTPHVYGCYNAYQWQFGIISANASNTGANYLTVCPAGAFYVSIGKKDTTSSASIKIWVTNKNAPGHEPETESDWAGMVSPSEATFNAVYPIVVTATLTSNGWSVATNQSGVSTLAGNWTTDLVKQWNSAACSGGASHTTNATITDEFANGAFVFCHGRNSGIDGITTNDPYPANTGELDSVTVQVNGSGNIFPACSITSPSNGVVIVTPADITINANANDPDGSISNVEFYQGSTKLGEDTSSPYSYTWNSVTAGSYSLTVKAYDNTGAITTSQAVGVTVSDTAPGILRVHPANRRYLTDGTGRAIYLTGSHTWFLIQKCSNMQQTDNSYQNMETYLDWVQGFGHNFQRVWENFADYQGPFPWVRSGTGTIWDGGSKFDMSQFDQTYFDLLRERVLQITNRGMYCSVMLFGSGVEFKSPPVLSDTDWSKCTWNPLNNVNSALASALSTTNGDTFYTSNTAAMDIQKALVIKMVDTLNDVDNLMWEVINEPRYPASTTWQSAMVSSDPLTSVRKNRVKTKHNSG